MAPRAPRCAILDCDRPSELVRVGFTSRLETGLCKKHRQNLELARRRNGHTVKTELCPECGCTLVVDRFYHLHRARVWGRMEPRQRFPLQLNHDKVLTNPDDEFHRYQTWESD